MPVSNPFRYQMWDNSVAARPVGRRRRVRYPITLAVQYAANGGMRGGTTSNISSSGLFIATRDVLPVDQPIKVTIDWPAVLDGRCPLCLVVMGRVCRISRHGMGIAIEKHEFQLRSARGARADYSSS